MKLEFMAAVYNEEAYVQNLIDHVYPYVDTINIVDDGSTDFTASILEENYIKGSYFGPEFNFKQIEHTGLPETVKSVAVDMCGSQSWIIMLDADERFAPGVLQEIKDFINSDESKDISWISFRLLEFIDGRPARSFEKVRLFRKGAVRFSTGIHEDDGFSGQGMTRSDWTVLHIKTEEKQRRREKEYIQTYKKLLEEGKIDQGRYNWLVGLHYFVRD